MNEIECPATTGVEPESNRSGCQFNREFRHAKVEAAGRKIEIPEIILAGIRMVSVEIVVTIKEPTELQRTQPAVRYV